MSLVSKMRFCGGLLQMQYSPRAPFKLLKQLTAFLYSRREPELQLCSNLETQEESLESKEQDRILSNWIMEQMRWTGPKQQDS